MMRHLRTLRDDERGFSFVFVSLSFMSFLAASMLAIDVGMLMTARTQAQSSADAGALAGATALVFNSYTDRSAAGPAVTSAINTARANLVIAQAPSVTPPDVTFPVDPATGVANLVEVSVYRTQERQNPVATLIGRIFGTSWANVGATARAAALNANSASCVLPWTIPDKWIEKQTPAWDPTDGFDVFAKQGNHSNMGAPLANPDIYVPPGQPSPTGYNAAIDSGLEITLKPSNGNEETPSMYNAWDINGISGAAAYAANIGGCNSTLVTIGDVMSPETGNMVGPTQQGTNDLKALDPNAWWDTTCNQGLGCVRDSAFQTSPRIRAVPLYDPMLYAQDQHSGKSQPTLKIVNVLGFFIEDVTGNGQVTGRICPILGRYNPQGPSATGGFASAIMMVK